MLKVLLKPCNSYDLYYNFHLVQTKPICIVVNHSPMMNHQKPTL